jgi:phosphoglycerate-specific signal transduction histidine kinase
MTSGLRSTIGLRLIVALSALATIGLGTAAVALWTFDRYGGAAEEIAITETRRLADVARFTEIATGVRAEMPHLVFAETERDKVAARRRLDSHSQALAAVVGRLELPGGPGGQGGYAEFGSGLRADIERIDANVTERIAIRGKVRARVERLRYLHEQFQREMGPLLADAAFNIQSALRRMTDQQAGATGPAPMVQKELAASDALSQLQGHINLLLGRIFEAAVEKRRGEIERIRRAVEEAIDTAAPIDAVLRDVPSAITLRQIWREIDLELTSPPRLLDQKLREAASSDEGVSLAAAMDGKLSALADLVARTVVQSNEFSIQAAQRVREAINRGTLLILVLGGAMAVVCFIVGWFYVGRRFIARLSTLLFAMRDVAAGNLDRDVLVSGDDEIGQLADALRRLQQRSQLARERRLALAAANEQLAVEIAERCSAQTKLEEAQEELVQAGKLAAVGQLSAGVAHEFNQPLAAIRSYLHNAGRYLEAGKLDKVGEKHQQIENLLARLSRISKHLLTLARRHPRTAQRCLVMPAIERAAELFEMRIGAGRARLTIVPHPRLSHVQAEPNRLEQVFINLLSNAFDAVEEREDAEIMVWVSESGDRQRVFIADNGLGISPSVRERLFDPFVTTKPAGAGLGLGLTIAFNIVQDFQGRLAIRNRRNGGAVAVVVLRTAPVAATMTAHQEAHAGE